MLLLLLLLLLLNTLRAYWSRSYTVPPSVSI